jgi:hypothetical protein
MRHVTPNLRVVGATAGIVQLITSHNGDERMIQLRADEVLSLMLSLIIEQRDGFKLARMDVFAPELMTLLKEIEFPATLLHYELVERESAVRIMREKSAQGALL